MTKVLSILKIGVVDKKLALDEMAMSAPETTLNIGLHQETILQLLFKYHEAECSDPRDRIAALLSMADPASREYGAIRSAPAYLAVNYDIFLGRKLLPIHTGSHRRRSCP